MIKLPAIATAVLLLTGAPQAQLPSNDIEGRIVRADNNQPVSNARLSMSPVADPGSPGYLQIPDVIASVSKDDGTFVFDRIPPDRYFISVQADGYVRNSYGPFELGAGKTVKDISIRMIRSGSMSGRILAPAGPVQGMEVALVRSGYDSQARKTFASVASGSTDDRGEYRLFGIQPGRYYLMVRAPAAPSATSAVRVSGTFDAVTAAVNSFLLLRKYTTTYFPGTSELARAELIDIAAGAELKGMDLVVKEQGTYHVRGRVIDTATGQPPAADGQSVGIGMFPRPTIAVTGSSFSIRTGADGTFDIDNVPPGGGVIVALRQGPSVLPSPGPLPRIVPPANRRAAQLAFANVDVYNSDVENVVLNFAPLMRVSGHLSVDGGTLADVPGFNRIQAQLVSPEDYPHIPIPAKLGREHTPPAADGAFVYDGVIPAEYELSFTGLPPDVYVKQVRYGDVDVLAKTLPISGDGKDSLNIVISAKAGHVDGNVLDWAKRPGATMQVVLIPDRLRDKPGMYRAVSVDGKGHFTIDSIPPGDYKLFAWEDAPPYAYFDPNFLGAFEDKGVSVHIVESSRQTADVSRIPLMP